jgi:CRISPR-associated protein Cas1
MEAPLISVAGLHALTYCERLFYFEEVERIRVADRAVFAGRRLHEEVAQDLEGDWEHPVLESKALGIQGAVDVLRCVTDQRWRDDWRKAFGQNRARRRCV